MVTLADALEKAGAKYVEPEREFQNRVVHLAQLYKWRVAHFRKAPTTRTHRGKKITVWQTAIQYDGKGFPDLVLARNGRVLFVELKAENGRLSKEQRAWLVELGDIARVWRPRDWDSIREDLR